MGARAAAAMPEARSTRDVVLDAAERLFARRGYAAVSMRDLTAAAGLGNQASLYHHFRNKQALYEAALSRALDPIAAVVIGRDGRGSEAAAGLAPRVLEAGLDRLVDYLAEHPQRARLIQRAGLDDSRYLPRIAARLLRPVFGRGLEVLATAGGTWQPEELPHVALGIFHLIFGYFANTELMALLMEGDPRGAAALERQRRLVKTAAARLLGAGTAEREVSR